MFSRGVVAHGFTPLQFLHLLHPDAVGVKPFSWVARHCQPGGTVLDRSKRRAKVATKHRGGYFSAICRAASPPIG